MGAYDWLHSQFDKLPDDPAGTPFIQGSDNPLDILSGKTKIGPDKASTANLDEATKRGFSLSDALGGERSKYTGNYYSSAEKTLRGQQQDNISNLFSAAAGKTPSPAEIQLQQMAGQNAARQFGLATALQGRNPGAALRSGRLGSLATQDQANVEAAMMRAKEQENARNALIQALASARGQEQNLLGLDTDWRKTLLQSQLEALGLAGKAAGAQFEGENKNAAATNQFNGDILKMIAAA